MTEPVTEPGRRLVLLRHGRTEWNASRRIQGQLDPGLDEVGHEQAQRAAPVLAGFAPVALLSSDLRRARETAGYLAAAADLTPTYDERLREWHLGERQGLTHEEYAALDPAEYARFRSGMWDDVPGAETVAEVAARFTAVVKHLESSLERGQCAVVVAHGAAIRTGLAHWLGWPPATVRDLHPLANCGWLELVERPDGRWCLASYNRTA